MSTEPVRQHFVPKVYLRSFCKHPIEDERIYTHDIKTGKSYVASITRTAVTKHFYTIAQGDGYKPTVVEDELSAIESAVAPIIRAIQRAEALPDDPDAISVLATFIATLYLRTPQGRRVIYGYREEVRASESPESPTHQHGLDEIISLDDEEINELSSISTVVVGKRVGIHLRHMHWRLLRTKGSYFITSESPVYSIHETDKAWGFSTPGVRIFFPLSPSLLIHLSNEPVYPGKGTADLPLTTVRGINALTVSAAERCVYSDRAFDDLAELLDIRAADKGPAFGPL